MKPTESLIPEKPKVENDPRRIFTRTQRARLFIRANGLCDLCGNKIIGKWIAGHIIPWALGGKTELDNGRVECLSCGGKTHKIDTGDAAKVRRLQKPKKPGQMKSRGFDKSLRKKMNGKVVRREQ